MEHQITLIYLIVLFSVHLKMVFFSMIDAAGEVGFNYERYLRDKPPKHVSLLIEENQDYEDIEQNIGHSKNVTIFE